MSPNDWFKVPTNPIVLGSQAEEIQEHVKRLAMVGLRRGGVIVTVLVVIFDYRFQNQRQVADRFLARQNMPQFIEQPQVRISG